MKVDASKWAVWTWMAVSLAACNTVRIEDGGAASSTTSGASTAAGQGGKGGEGGQGGDTSTGGAPSVEVRAQTLATGNEHTCMIDSEGRLWCWGGNSLGQLGDGTTTDRLTPTWVSSLTHKVVQVSAGALHTCAVLEDDTLWCWGKNDFGHLGVGTITPYEALPLKIVGLGSSVKSVAAGGQHTCAVLIGGSTWCWGWNLYGQIGDGSTIDRNTPALVSAVPLAAEVSVSFVHSCARTPEGAVWCWGGNTDGQIGDGTITQRLLPVPVLALGGNVAQIDLGGWHSCARAVDGTMSCWGYNSQGGLGNGSKFPSSLPVQVAIADHVTDIGVDAGHSCAVTIDALVQCWGWNGYGQIGDDSNIDSPIPLSVPIVSDAAEIDLGYWHSCARTHGGVVWCWGQNEHGQLGDGSTVTSASPVKALLVP